MFKPIPLNLPPAQLKLTQRLGKVYFYDILRKKHLLLTPEEWVRQHWIYFLNNYKFYPLPLMKTEAGLILNNLQKRSDLMIYNNIGEKILLAEFKAPSVKITNSTFEQISSYNIIHKIPLLLVSNGIDHYYCKVDFRSNSYKFIDDVPNYNLQT